MKMDHIGISVDDLYAMESFYRHTLGFDLVYRYTSRNTPGLRTVFLRREEAEIELLQHAALCSGEKKSLHVGLRVDDVDGEYDRLAALGAPGLVSPRDTGDGYREFSLEDPEGNRIEICRRIRPFVHPPIRGVIFDLDGTLVDSEDNYYEADRLLFAEYGIDFRPEQKARFVGYSNLSMMRDLRLEYGLAESAEELVEKKNEIYMRLARVHTPLFPEMGKLLEGLKARGIPMSIASGSSPEVIREIVDAVDIAHHFGVVVSSEEVAHGKPSPDVFLEAARRMGLDPREALVMEDARFGVEAAVRASMACVAIPTVTTPPLDPAFFMADLLFEDGMEHFSAEALLSWIDRRGES